MTERYQRPLRLPVDVNKGCQAVTNTAQRVINKMPEAMLVGVITTGVSAASGPEAAIPLGILAFCGNIGQAIIDKGTFPPSSLV